MKALPIRYNINMDTYNTTSYAKFRLKYHMLLVTKYRKNCLSPIVRNTIRYDFECSKTNDFTIEICEFDDSKPNHVHLLIQTKPHISSSQVVSRINQYYITYVWKDNREEISLHYWGNRYKSWTRGYFVCTVGQTSEDTIRHYIENQD